VRPVGALPSEAGYPAAAAAYLAAHDLPGPLFDDDWGGSLLWLLFPRYPVFVDGRIDVYGNAFIEEVPLPPLQARPGRKSRPDCAGVCPAVRRPAAHHASPAGRRAPGPSRVRSSARGIYSWMRGFPRTTGVVKGGVMRAVLWQLWTDETGQDFMEYAILGGAIAAVAAGVIYLFRNELTQSFQCMVSQLRSARGQGSFSSTGGC
jgi:Flp pilus assembly pilin Flp